MAQLKKGDISMREIYNISKRMYYKKVDNKAKRARMDITSAKLTLRNNMSYNYTTKKWEQDGRNVKMVFIVSSKPKSYKLPKYDKGVVHRYPVTFLIRNIEQGIDSSFKFRTGSLKRPILLKKGASAKEREKAYKTNIKNGVQLDDFFNAQGVLFKYGLLYGANYTNKLPVKSMNTDHIPYFSKHALFCFESLILPIINSKKGAFLNRVSKKR